MIPDSAFPEYLLAAEQAGVLPAFLTQHYGSRGNTFTLLAEKVFSLLQNDGDATLLRLNAALNDDFAPAFILRYAMACLAAKADDVVATHRALCQAVRIGAAGKGLFAKDSLATKLFYCALQQAFVIDPAHPTLRSPLPSLSPMEPTERNGLVALTACNGLYFERFGPSYVASAAPIAGLHCHIHVVNPTENIDSLFATLKEGARAELTLSCDSGPTHPSFYACKRFLIANDIMDRFKADLIITDIDTHLTPALLDLPQMVDGADCGLFQRPVRTAPMEICHCSLSFFRRAENVRRFLQILRAYAQAKLDEYDVWMTDQSSLFTLSRLAASEGNGLLGGDVPPLRWRDFSSLSMPSLDALNPNQAIAAETAEKHVMRDYQSIGDAQINIDANGRPSFARQ